MILFENCTTLRQFRLAVLVVLSAPHFLDYCNFETKRCGVLKISYV